MIKDVSANPVRFIFVADDTSVIMALPGWAPGVPRGALMCIVTADWNAGRWGNGTVYGGTKLFFGDVGTGRHAPATSSLFTIRLMCGAAGWP